MQHTTSNSKTFRKYEQFNWDNIHFEDCIYLIEDFLLVLSVLLYSYFDEVVHQNSYEKEKIMIDYIYNNIESVCVCMGLHVMDFD